MWLLAGGLLVAVGVMGFLWYLGGVANKLSPDDTRLISLVARANNSAPLITAPTPSQPAWQYSPSDITISATTQPSAIRAYGLELANILRFYAEPEWQNEMALTVRAIKNDDALAAKMIVAQRLRQQQAVGQLVNVVTPEDAADIHLQLINTILRLAELDFAMEKIFDQPILALENARIYPQHYSELWQIFAKINQYFLDREIVFSSEEKINLHPSFNL